MKLDDIGAWITLTVLLFLVLGILSMLFRFWGDCRRDVALAKERISWPITTVQATLTDAFTRVRRLDRPRDLRGLYSFSFQGHQHTFERFEPGSGTDEEMEAAAAALKREGKTIDLEVQYNPEDPSEVLTGLDIVREVPGCTPWVGGFLLLFSFFLLLILRGFYRLLTG